MNLVVLTPYLPYPGVPHGGGADLLALLEFLSPRHTLRVLSFVDDATAAHADALRPLVAELRLVRPAVTLRQKLTEARAALRTGRLGTLGRRADGEVRAALAAWAAAGQMEALYCAWTEMGRYLLDAPPGVVRALDEVDIRWRVEAAAALDQPWRWPGVWRRREAERAYCRAAHLVVTRSAHDAALLRAAVPEATTVVLPPVAHTAAFLNLPPEASRPGRVLFVGALDRARNQAAARWLVAAVWPLVRAECPAAELRFVGANPPPDLLALNGQPGLTVTGWVDDLAAEYAPARVIAAPLFGAAGALNKVMDGLAAGRPIVATRAANAGLDAPPAALLTASTAAEFAQGIIRLLTDDALWQSMSAAARRFAAATFDWPAAAARVEAALVATWKAYQGTKESKAPLSQSSA